MAFVLNAGPEADFSGDPITVVLPAAVPPAEADPSVDFTASEAGVAFAVYVEGVDGSAPISLIATGSSGTTTPAIDPPDGYLLLGAAFDDPAGSPSVTWTDGTELVEGVRADNALLSIASKEHAGAADALEFTFSDAGSGGTIIFALKPGSDSIILLFVVTDSDHTATSTDYTLENHNTGGATGMSLLSKVLIADTARSGTSSVSGGGSVASATQKSSAAASSVAGGGTVGAAARKGAVSASSVAAGGGSLSCSAATQRLAGSLVSGGGRVVSIGSAIEAHSGSSTVSGGGSLSTSGRKDASAASVLTGGGGLAAGVATARFSTTVVSGGGRLTAAVASARLSVSLVSGGGRVTTAGVGAGEPERGRFDQPAPAGGTATMPGAATFDTPRPIPA